MLGIHFLLRMAVRPASPRLGQNRFSALQEKNERGVRQGLFFVEVEIPACLTPIRHLKSALKAPGEGGRRSWIFQLIKGFKKFAAEGEGFVPPPQYI